MSVISSVNDYVVFEDKEQRGKRFLARVQASRGKDLVVDLEHDKHIEPVTVTIPAKSVLISLGQNPVVGTVYGVDVGDVYRKSVRHDVWGDIYFFTSPSKEWVQVFRESLDRTAKVLTKAGFGALFNHFIVEVRTRTGKYAGMYKHSGNDKRPNRLIICPPREAVNQETNVDVIDSYLYHEFGHALERNLVNSAKVYAQWVRMYNTSVLVKPISQQALAKVFKTWIDRSEARLSDSMREMEEDDVLVCRAALRVIKQVNRIGIKEVDALMESGKFEELDRLWPDSRIDVGDLAPIVSEYATKNVHELFAESFQMYMRNRKLPKSVVTLTEKTLDLAKANASKL